MMSTQNLSIVQTGLKPTTASAVQVTERRLHFIRDVTFDEYQEIGRDLDMARQAIQFWIGDFILYGEEKFGERAYQAIGQATGLDEDTLRQAAWVSSKVEPANRNPNLSFTHHRAVATLNPAEQKAILDQAEANQWSEKLTIQAVRQYKSITQGTPPPVIKGVCGAETCACFLKCRQ